VVWAPDLATPRSYPHETNWCVNLSHGAQEVFLMSKFNPFEFVQEVRQEVSKVTWPTWKEVWITTLMVLVMVTLASVFFLVTDQVLGRLVNLVLRLNA
jgi:preprotein translocase subunit SecE